MRNFRNIFLTMVLAFVSVTVRGQFVGDLASIEALIADHKAQRKVLAVRSITEGSVYALHNLSQTSTSDWKHINIELDKYRRAFDWLTLALDALETGVNTYTLITEITSSDGTVHKYNSLIDNYYRQCILTGNVCIEDTLIVSIARGCINSIKGDVKDLEIAMTDLFLLCSGQVQCTTYTLSLIFTRLNNAVEHIDKVLHRCYFESFKFIHARTSFWKRSIHKDSKYKKTLSNEAMERWASSRHSVSQRMAERIKK